LESRAGLPAAGIEPVGLGTTGFFLKKSEMNRKRVAATATKVNAAKLSVGSNSFLILIKLFAGIITGSVSLVAEAVHSLMDLAAAGIALVSVRISDKPGDKQHPYGHGKAENISGVAEAVLIFVAAGIIIYEAVKRLITGRTLELLEIGIAIMVVSIVVNVFVSRYLLKVAKNTDSLALEGDARHLTTDVLTMVGVLVGLILVRFTGLSWIDPVVAILVALFIMRTAYELIRKSFGGLIDVKLPEAEESIIRSCIVEHSYRVVAFHDLRTRKAGSYRYVDLHLVMPKNESVEKAHRMCDHLERDIKNRLPRTYITIHVEPCATECEQCSVSCTIKDRG
jgi:cation diffusion facilitator family transporter